MKKLRKEVEECPPLAGLWALVDAQMMDKFNITTDEIDMIAEAATEEEGETFMSDDTSFGVLRQKLEIRNKYVPYYQEKWKQENL